MYTVNIYSFMQKTALFLTFLLGFNSAFAGKNLLTECPSVDELKTFNFDSAIPYRFDNSTKSMKFITFADKSIDDDADLVLALYPVMVGVGEQPEKNMHELIEKLQLESMTRLSYRIADDITLPMCVYTLPGNNNVSALVIYDNGDIFDENYVALEAKSNKHLHSIKMVKQFMLN